MSTDSELCADQATPPEATLRKWRQNWSGGFQSRGAAMRSGKYSEWDVWSVECGVQKNLNEINICKNKFHG